MIAVLESIQMGSKNMIRCLQRVEARSNADMIFSVSELIAHSCIVHKQKSLQHLKQRNWSWMLLRWCKHNNSRLWHKLQCKGFLHRHSLLNIKSLSFNKYRDIILIHNKFSLRLSIGSLKTFPKTRWLNSKALIPSQCYKYLSFNLKLCLQVLWHDKDIQIRFNKSILLCLKCNQRAIFRIKISTIISIKVQTKNKSNLKIKLILAKSRSFNQRVIRVKWEKIILSIWRRNLKYNKPFQSLRIKTAK